VDIIIDASSVINLDNAGALELLAGLQARVFWISPLVVGECDPTCAAEIVRLRDMGRLHFVDPQNVSAELYLTLLEIYDLGEGETECLALCHGHQFLFCCDDQRARTIAGQLFGGDRVIGSLRLLRWAVIEGLASTELAFDLYEKMKSAGGFLPAVDKKWFSESE
jgi:predicted nucleic acid-binding protein